MTPDQLNAKIDEFIIPNNASNEITGAILNDILHNIVALLPASVEGTQIFPADQVVNIAPGDSFGRFTNGQTITANGLSAVDVIMDALSQTIHPNYVTPTVQISASPSTSQRYEVGSSQQVTITGAFTQNDGGGVMGYVVQRNGSQVGTSLPFSETAVLANTSNTQTIYTLVASYAQGPVKNNNLGVADSVGQIAAGSVLSIAAFTPAYLNFYGPAASIPTSSSAIRTLPNQAFLYGTDGGFKPTLNTGTSQVNFVVAIKDTYSIVSVVDQDALNLDLTSQYVLTNTIVLTLPSGASTNYKVYAMTQAVPYTVNHRHNITIA